MRSVLAALFIAVTLSVSGCAFTMSGPLFDPDGLQPGYVYLYPNGCWADDAWYSPCPWQPGPNYGYYYFGGGSYYWHGHRHWEYRPGYPPPRAWHRPDPRWNHPYPARPVPPHHGHGGPRGPHGFHGGPHHGPRR